MWKVQLFKLNYDKRESQAVKEIVYSGWITMGEKTKEFEKAFSNYHNGVHCTEVSSAMVALH